MQARSLGSTRNRTLALVVLLGGAAIALLAGLAYAGAQIAEREARIASLTVANSDLLNANSALRDDVSRLTREREELLRTQEALKGQLLDARAQSDQLASDRDRIQAEADRLRRENQTLSAKLAAAPTPAPATGGVDRAAVPKVLALDDQIERDYDAFYRQLQDVLTAFDRGDMLRATLGVGKARQMADQLKEQFKARNKAAEPLR